MRVYLAHPVTDYGSARQAQAIDLLRANGWKVENPDQPHHASAYLMYGMGHFKGVVNDCDGLAFLRFPDGSIGSGVATEIETALRRGLPVWDISSGKLESVGTMMPFPLLSANETRAMIASLKAKAEGEIHSPSDRSAPSIGSTTRIDRTSDGARE